MRKMKKTKIIDFMPAIIFFGFIFVIMILLFVLPKSEYSAQEKKKLADFPEMNVEKVVNAEFQNQLDTYMSDHIPARNFWAGLSSDYELAVGRNGSKGIYLGSDGYLFPKPTKSTDNLMKNAGYIKEFADDSDIPIYMTVVPSSGFINSSKLPFNHEPYIDGEMIASFGKSLGDNVKFTDVCKSFSELSSSRQLYYKTDHHWTSEGAFECYKLLAPSMGYDPLSEDAFSKKKIEGFYGTSYSKSALWMMAPDTIELWQNKAQPKDSGTVEITDGKDSKKLSSYFSYEQLENDDKYPVFLDGNHSLVRIKNSNVTGGKLIVVKDSYGHTIVPFLSQNYSEIIMVDMRYYKKEISALAEKEKADGILFIYSLDNLAADNNLAYLF